MTLKELIQEIWDIAKQQPNINEIIFTNDIYDLNTRQNIKYAAFCITQQQHRQDENFIYYNLYLYYVDRLQADQSDALHIQSHALEVLKNIIAQLQDNHPELEISNILYTPFRQKFESETAGIYASIQISDLITNKCPENYNKELTH